MDVARPGRDAVAGREGGDGLIVQQFPLTTATVSRNLPFVATYRDDDGWDALGDPTRRAIVERLAERPRAVGELADELPVSRPAVSQHLKVLKDAGLVTEQAAGTRRIYRLNPAGVAALRDQLDTFWNRALAGYRGRRRTNRRRSIMTADRQPPWSAGRSSSTHRSSGRSRCSPSGSATSSRRSTTCSASPIAETVFEPQVGGHIYDRGVDGSECRWARILAYEPPDRVVFSWDIGPTLAARDRPGQHQRGRGPVRRRDARTAPGSSSSTATSTGTAPAGRRVRDGVEDEAGWPLYLDRYHSLFQGKVTYVCALMPPTGRHERPGKRSPRCSKLPTCRR